MQDDESGLVDFELEGFGCSVYMIVQILQIVCSGSFFNFRLWSKAIMSIHGFHALLKSFKIVLYFNT